MEVKKHASRIGSHGIKRIRFRIISIRYIIDKKYDTLVVGKEEQFKK